MDITYTHSYVPTGLEYKIHFLLNTVKYTEKHKRQGNESNMDLNDNNKSAL